MTVKRFSNELGSVVPPDAKQAINATKARR
jgi:hypothetical protein